MKIKIIRKTDDGPKQGEIFEARELLGLIGKRFQILSDGEYLGEFVAWQDAIEIPDNA